MKSREHEQVRRLIDSRVAKQATRLKQNAQKLINKKISLSRFEAQMRGDIVSEGHKMLELAAGGEDGLTSAHSAVLAKQIFVQEEFLTGFLAAITSGMSDKALIARAGSYARSAATIYFAGEKITREIQGYREALRRVDNRSVTCDECSLYDTGGKWVPIGRVVPPGVDCSCGGRCRCRVIYRKMGDNRIKLSDTFYAP